MSLLTRTSHRVAAGLGALFLALALIMAARHREAQQGWSLASGSNDLIVIMLLVMGSVMAIAFALLRPSRANPRGGRLTAVVWSLALVAALFFTLYVVAVADRWVETIGTPMTSPQDVAAFEDEHEPSFNRYSYRVPTGAFLQSFEFLNSHNVEMSGYIWQFYTEDIPDTVTRGIVFPEALEEAYEAVEAWRVQKNGGEEIGWYFSGTFRQNFNYRLYPFDRQAVWLRLWHPDPDRSVLLVPDFASYSSTQPEALPGIEKDFVYGGWDPIHSGFTYSLITYSTHFGLGGQLNGIPYPDLYFNLSVKRDFLGPMLQHLVLEIAIAVLLFFLLVLTTYESDIQERLGLTVFDLIVASGGLLFAVILDLNSIRGSIESQDITYLEWYPLILVVFIVLVVLSAVLKVQEWRVPVLGYTGYLVPALAYWPALLGTLLVVTLKVFFF